MMASDLSTLIKDGLCETLNSLLSKNTNIEQITKVHPNDLTSEVVKVDIIYEFTNLKSTWSFLIPAISSSYILNLMMGEEEAELSDTINDEIIDALKEVVSTISGGLTTSINGAGLEDLGSVKFILDAASMANGSDYTSTENIFKFAILLEERNIEIFIIFDEPIIEYIQEISSSELSHYEEEVEEEVASKEEVKEESEEINNEIEEESKEELSEVNKETENETTQDEDKPKEIEDESDKKISKFAFLKKIKFFSIDKTLSQEDQKKEKLKKIIIVVGSLFILVLLTGLVLFFTGAFDPEDMKDNNQTNSVNDTNQTLKPTSSKVIIKSKYKKKEISFRTSQINVKRLNRKLQLLTKYEILEDDNTELLKAQEKERLYKEKQKRLDDFAKKNTEESIQNKLPIKQTITKDKFIQLPTLQINKFKKFISYAKKVNANLSICKDNNGRTQVLIGPFKDLNIRKNTLSTLDKKLLKKIKKLDLSKDEFKKLCNF